MKRIAFGIQTFLSRQSAAQKMTAVLAALGVCLLVYLLVAPKPWSVHVEPGKNMKIAQYVTIYLWIGLLLDFLGIAFLAITTRWWMRPMKAAAPAAEKRKYPRWFWPLIIAAMALNAWLCWPRLWHSFWHDETYPIRNAILGTYRVQDDGSLKLKRLKWNDTLFFYKKPNHTFYSGVARLINDAWIRNTQPRGLQFNEPLIRLPAYIAGIASIATISLLLGELEFFSAGAIAAFLSAIHPWHIRYASEARAYGFMLCLLPLACFFILRAVSTGRWRWWAAFGAAEFLLMYSYPTCAYVLIVLNLPVPFLLWKKWKPLEDAITQGFRWMVANVFAAIAFLPLMLPCAPQFAAYSKDTAGIGDLSNEWVSNFLAHLVAGIPWLYRGHYEPKRIELFPWFEMHPGLGVLAAVLAVTFVVLGVRRMICKGGGFVAAALLLPAAICFADTKVRGGHIHIWYLIFLLPGAIALAALGMDEFLSAPKSMFGKIAGAGFVLLVLGSYTAWTSPQRFALRHFSLQPNRESVLATRSTLDPNDARQKHIITATFLGPPEPYDPNIIEFHTAKELGELVHRADAEGKELFINIGYLTTVEGEHPNKLALLRKSGMFKEVPLPLGYEPTLQSRQVYRYKPGTGTNFDFNKVPPDRGRPGSPYYYYN